METKKLTNSDIIEMSKARNVPCVKESGECFVVRAISLYVEGDVCEPQKMTEVNAFATEGEARGYAAKMTENADDAESALKHVYTVEQRWVF